MINKQGWLAPYNLPNSDEAVFYECGKELGYFQVEVAEHIINTVFVDAWAHYTNGSPNIYSLDAFLYLQGFVKVDYTEVLGMRVNERQRRWLEENEE